MNPVLEFKGVTLAAVPPYETGLCAVSFSLGPGDLALVRLPLGTTVTPLADLACGLIEPDEGEVRFFGAPWAGRPADRAAVERGRIGRVFERSGWISNLDVDENVTLARRYHQRLEPDVALAAARDLAGRLGLAGLPVGRPDLASRADLLRAQWVRALLGEPALLLLERPGRDLPRERLEPLVAEVALRRAAGCAVLWLNDDHERLDEENLRPTLKFVLRDGNIRPREPT